MEDRMTKEQLLHELEEMRRQVTLLDKCGMAMQAVQAKYEKLLESAPDAMFFIDQEARIVLANVQAEKLFGYSGEELVGKDLHLLVPERYRLQHKNKVADYFSNPRTRNMGTSLNIYGLNREGQEFPVDISLSPIETDGGLLVIASIRDITERKLAELQIERNYRIQTAISSVLKISLEPISLEEQLNRVLDLVLAIPGLSSQAQGSIYTVETEPELLILKAGRSLPDRPPPRERIPFGQCLCGKDISTCPLTSAEVPAEKPPMEKSFESPPGSYCQPIASAGRTLGLINISIEEGHRKTAEEERFLAAVADTLAAVMTRQQAEKEKNQLKEELAEAEKTAALGRITASVADKIRNPLTAIGGFARRLDHKIPDGSKEKEYSKFILTEVSRLEKVLRNVLSLYQVSNRGPEKCDLREIIQEALGIFEEPFKERSIAVERSFGEVPVIQGERELFLVAIENLIVNAMDAMPLGGRLTIATQTELIKRVAHAVVKVGDSGEGIKEEDLNRIFEPFFTTKVSTKRFGLGLSLVKRVVEDHQGWIRVESTAGTGSTFVLYFPSALP